MENSFTIQSSIALSEISANYKITLEEEENWIEISMEIETLAGQWVIYGSSTTYKRNDLSSIENLKIAFKEAEKHFGLKSDEKTTKLLKTA